RARDVLPALFRLRRAGAALEDVDVAIQEISPWLILGAKIESAACDVHLSGGLLTPHAHCILRTQDGVEREFDVEPRVRPSLATCLVASVGVSLGLPFLMQANSTILALSAICGLLGGFLVKLIFLSVDHGDARDV